jgi:arylsulfatase A-like enzyme
VADGLSLLPLLKDPSATLPRQSLHWHYPHYHSAGATPHGAIRVGKWKLIEFFEDQHVELYDLANGTGEQTNLATRFPEKAEKLQIQLAQWRASVGAQMPIADVQN